MSNRSTNRAAAALAAVLAVLPARGEEPASPAPPCHGPAAAAAEAAGDPHEAHRAAAAAPPAAGKAAEAATEVEIRFPNADLLDQDGRAVRFAEHVLAGKVVVMDFVFTTCTTVCPVLNAIMGQVQEKVPSLGEEVVMVTVTVDPARDTPERLKAASRRLKAGPGWTWLTGSQENVKQVLKSAGAWTPNFQDHPPMVLVGDGRTGKWTRLNGFPGAERIAGRVNDLLAARRTLGAAGGR